MDFEKVEDCSDEVHSAMSRFTLGPLLKTINPPLLLLLFLSSSRISPAQIHVPSPSTVPEAPRIFNVPLTARAGDIVSIQGSHLDSTARVWLAGASGDSSQVPIVNRAGQTLLVVQLPAFSPRALILWVSNSHGVSNSVKLNGATPFHLDSLQLVPGGSFKVVGLNLLQPGSLPSVTVNGRTAKINVAASNENVLSVTAPVSLAPSSAAVIMVDNGNGTGPTQLDRQVQVVSGSGDPLGLGVGWAAAFSFVGHKLPVKTSCDGAHDDSGNIQRAIDAAARDGGIVTLPAGNCRLASSLTMRSMVVIQGAGKDKTIVHYESNYPVSALGLDRVGIRNLTIINAGKAAEGLIWKQNNRSFLQNVKVDSGISRQLYLTDNKNFVVNRTDIVQRGSINQQNPYLFDGCSGFVFSDNTSLTVDGSPTFESVHDALITGNHFTRDALHQDESVVISSHGLVMDFAYRIAIIGNTFDVAHGPITNHQRNDGETLLSEGGGGKRTESLGVAVSGTPTTLYDPHNAIDVNPFGSGIPEDYGVAIVSGTGAGQTREVLGYAHGTLRVNRAWDVIPDATSHYATFLWGLDKAVIKGNRLLGNPRGIWLYRAAFRDVDIEKNTIIDGGGILAETFQSESEKQFDLAYDVRIADNVIRNVSGRWMSYVDAIFVNKDASPFGTADIGIEIRGNSILANTPNASFNSEGYANQEGFASLMRSESSAPQRSPGSETLLGTIFQRNSCQHCQRAFVVGTGDRGFVLSIGKPMVASSGFSDWQTLGQESAGSVDTLAQ